jgi:hypothetical protein
LNDRFWDEGLKVGWFPSLAEARVIIRRWRQHYREERPHRSLGERTPAEGRPAWKAKQAGPRPRTPGVWRSGGQRLSRKKRAERNALPLRPAT